jgi:hypothetical protein
MESARHGSLSRSVDRRGNILPSLSRPRDRDRHLRSSLRRLSRGFDKLRDRPSRDRASNLHGSDPLVGSHRAPDRRRQARSLLLHDARRNRRTEYRGLRAQDLFHEHGRREGRFPERRLQGRQGEAFAQVIPVCAPARSIPQLSKSGVYTHRPDDE